MLPHRGCLYWAARIKELLWIKEAWARKEENPTPPEDITSKSLRLVSWSDEEKNLSPEEQKDIALVKSVDGRTLTSVLHSRVWRKTQGLVTAPTDEPDKSSKKSKSKKRTPTPSPSERSPSLPPPFEEEGIAPFVFSDEDNGSALRRHPEPSPLPSPVREWHGTRPASENLFIGAAKQQQYLQSSDIETPPGRHEYYDNADEPVYSQQVHFSEPRRPIYGPDSHSHSYSRAPTLVQSKPFDSGMRVPPRSTMISTKNKPVPPSMNPDSRYWSHERPASRFNVQHPKIMPQRPDPARRPNHYQPMPQMYSAGATGESRYTGYRADTGAGHSQHARSLKRLREEEEGSSLKRLRGKEEGSTSRPAKKRITGKAFKDLLLKQRTK
ncbi:hypothetical protein VKT23_016681 [Stygiomarasmius scandens]|uniref:Uncharacterized protein n=1 Tax=Marasmiellus scandens TaxID=2682957 RepID=A0ABR1IYL7_9AGAR